MNCLPLFPSHPSLPSLYSVLRVYGPAATQVLFPHTRSVGANEGIQKGPGKYCLALFLYRLREKFQRSGFPLSLPSHTFPSALCPAGTEITAPSNGAPPGAMGGLSGGGTAAGFASWSSRATAGRPLSGAAARLPSERNWQRRALGSVDCRTENHKTRHQGG